MSGRLLPRTISKLRHEVLLPQHFDQVLEFFVKNYAASQPIFRCLSFSENDALTLFPDRINRALKHPISFGAFEEPGNQLVGCQLNALVDFGEKQARKSELDLTENAAKIYNFNELISGDFGSFLGPNEQRWFHGIMGMVRKDYERLGLAETSFDIARKVGLEMGVAGQFSESNTIISQTLVRRLPGASILRTVYHKNYLDESGRRIFSCDDGTDRGELLMIRYDGGKHKL